jgi:ABC-type proline/glycine betaine transport system substrate-binding protein
MQPTIHPTINKNSCADSFRSLAGDFEKLEAAIDGADPSADAKASYTTLSKMLAATLKQWQALKTGEIAALNAALTAAGEKTLVVQQ